MGSIRQHRRLNRAFEGAAGYDPYSKTRRDDARIDYEIASIALQMLADTNASPEARQHAADTVRGYVARAQDEGVGR